MCFFHVFFPLITLLFKEGTELPMWKKMESIISIQHKFHKADNPEAQKWLQLQPNTEKHFLKQRFNIGGEN